MDAQKTLQKAISLFNQSLHYQSLEALTQLLTENPHNGKAWELKGLIEDTLHWHKSSINSLETATTLIPISASGQYILAKNYHESGKHSLARSIFSILLQRKDIPEKLLPAISSYLGQYPDLTYLALEACRKAVELDPDCADSWFGVAYFMGKMGYPREHVANVLRKVVAIAPENRHYRIALGNLLEQIGQNDEAYFVVKAIKNSELNEIHCTECLQKLITIFSTAKDSYRIELCFKKLDSLQSAQEHSSSKMNVDRFLSFLKK